MSAGRSPSASAVEFGACVLSCLFRICAYIFLRVIPASQLKYTLPTLFAGFVSCFYLSPPALRPPAVDIDVSRVVVPNRKNKDGVKTETVEAVVRPAPRQSLASLVLDIVFSRPTPLKTNRLIVLATNAVLLACVAEFVSLPLVDPAADVIYTRVGAVAPTEAKIALRHPFTNASEGAVHVVYRQAAVPLGAVPHRWADGPIATVTAETDWTAVVRLTGLWPNTSYEYRLADAEKLLLPVPERAIPFRTFPDPRLPSGNHFRFIVSSCSTPNFPYRPLHGRRIKGYDLLHDYLFPVQPRAPAAGEALSVEDVLLGEDVPDSVPTASTDEVRAEVTPNVTAEDTGGIPEPTSSDDPVVPATPVPEPAPQADFMLFLGDFIYADVPIWWGESKEAYRRLYRRTYNSPSYRKIYERIPTLHVYDDHEIINNFAGLGNESTPPFPNASEAYTLYNGGANPDASVPGATYYSFDYGDSAFFVMDTRRYRSDVSAADEEPPTMLGEEQLAALYEWLGKVNTTSTFKFVVSSVPLTSLWTHEQTDFWAGFAAEKAALLEVLHTVPNVVVLSGDRHEAAVIKFNAPGRGHSLFEISTSPLSMFYIPFIRTLLPRSATTVERTVRLVTHDANGTTEVTETEEEVPAEVVLNYTPVGNYKWSAIEVDTRDYDHPVAKLELVSDGHVVYRLEIEGQPVRLRPSTALGALVPPSISQILAKIGFDPSKWF